MCCVSFKYGTVYKFGVSLILFKEINSFMQRGFIKLIKSDTEDI